MNYIDRITLLFFIYLKCKKKHKVIILLNFYKRKYIGKNIALLYSISATVILCVH